MVELYKVLVSVKVGKGNHLLYGGVTVIKSIQNIGD